MDRPPEPSFDPALLDMENMTSDKWYSLIYSRIVQQQDVFVRDFKKKAIEIVNTCTNEPGATLESIRQDLTNTINGSKFEFEHQKFIDGIVGGTYEYLCQFIIKNSMENIKRTQSALNCFSLTSNLNYGAIKSCCNENILLQGSSKLTQIQCLPESNNNTTDSDKAIPSYIFNNNSENDANSMLMVQRENVKNTSVSKIETPSFHNYRQTLQINNLSVESTDGTPLYNNIHTDDNVSTAHSSVIIDDDEKTTEAIISLALKIQQTNFSFVDNFEADDINVSDVVCTSNEIQTTKCLIEQNGEQNTDPLKLEEEYKIHNSLKILESLVNIEHDKLEVQKGLTTNEIQPNIETKEKTRFKSTKKTSTRKNKSQKFQENVHKDEDEEEEWLPSDDKPKNHCHKNKNKTNKSKSHKERASKNKIKLEVQNTLNSSSTSNSSYSTDIHNDESISLALNGPLFCSYTKKPETIVSSVTNTKLLDTNTNIGTQLVYEHIKDRLPTFDFKQPSGYDEKKNCLAITVNNSNALSIKTCPIASTSGYNEKNVDNFKNKSSSLAGPVMKTSDYKKLYEKDRKSLFSPDVVIIKNVPLKSLKDSANDLQVKKEYNSVQKKEDQDKKTKSKISKEESKNKTSNKRKRISESKVKKTNNAPKLTNVSKSKPNHTLTSLEQKPSNARSINKFKKFKVTMSDGDAKTNADINTNNESNNMDILKNKVSDKTDTSQPQKLDRPNVLKNNEYGEGTSKQNFVLENKVSKNGKNGNLNGIKILKPKKLFKDPLLDKSMPDWLRKKCELYNIKSLYVVLNPNITY